MSNLLVNDKIPARVLFLLPEDVSSAVDCPTGDLVAIRANLASTLEGAIARVLPSRFESSEVAVASRRQQDELARHWANASVFDRWDYIAVPRLEMREFHPLAQTPVEARLIIVFVPRDRDHAFSIRGVGRFERGQESLTFEAAATESLYRAINDVSAQLWKLVPEFKRWAG